MNIYDSNEMSSLTYISIPFTAVINNFIAVIILEERLEGSFIRCRLAVGEYTGSNLSLYDSVPFELDKNFQMSSIITSGVGPESVILKSTNEGFKLTTIDSNRPSDVVVNNYLLNNILTLN